jgi:hypothetical protein
VSAAYYCTLEVSAKTEAGKAEKLKSYWRVIQNAGWKVEILPRKPDGGGNVDASVGSCIAYCEKESDVLVFFGGDGDYFSSLCNFLKNGKPVFCVGDPARISGNIKSVANVINMEMLKPFVEKSSMSVYSINEDAS